MATHTVGTGSTSSLIAIQIPAAGGTAVAAADIASVNQLMVDDQQIVNSVTGLQQASIGNAALTTTVGTMTSVTISSGPPLTAALIGQFVRANGVVPGSFVTGVSVANATITLNQNPTTGTTGTNITFVATPRLFQGLQFNGANSAVLTIPGGRGQLTCKPGDIIAVDPITGWPVLISAEAAAIAGANFTFT